jgi:hypothetical protein
MEGRYESMKAKLSLILALAVFLLRAYSDKLAESSRGLAEGVVEGLFFDKKT